MLHWFRLYLESAIVITAEKKHVSLFFSLGRLFGAITIFVSTDWREPRGSFITGGKIADSKLCLFAA